MLIMKRSYLAVSIFLVMYLGSMFGQIKIDKQATFGTEIYFVFILFFVLVGIYYFYSKNLRYKEVEGEISFIRRIIAFCFDVVVIITASKAVSVLILYVTDAEFIVIFFSSFVLMYLIYILFSINNKRPTLGQYIAGYCVLSQSKSVGSLFGRSMLYIVLLLLEVYIIPFILIYEIIKGKVFFYERASSLHAVKIKQD